MYLLRRFSTRNAGTFEKLYNLLNPLILGILGKIKGIAFLEKVIVFIERHIKGLLFDCQMCGKCVLINTGMTCPMNCAKQMQNGPCGGVRADGNCEVKPNMRCVWVEAWQGAKKMKQSESIHDVAFAVDNRQKGTSSWLKLSKNKKKNV